MGPLTKGEKMSNKSNEASRSWFCVLNNPQKIFGNDAEPEQMVEQALDLWMKDKPQRACAINFEIGDTGTPHMHMVLEDPAKSRFTALQKMFPSIHIERTRGNKEQAEDYINKRGRFAEKSHTVVIPARYRGQIKASRGARNDLAIIEELIEQGKTPNEIMTMSIAYRNKETIIRKAYFAKRVKETPLKRDVTVYWHVGESGSGKSYTHVQLIEKHTQENVYLMTDYSVGGFDMYQGEPILFMDEFKGNMKFQDLLNYLDGYKIQIHCRYANAQALWTEVHITSIFPPEEAYKFMVERENQALDSIKQLMRRINYVVYHYANPTHPTPFQMDARDYTNYDDLKTAAHADNDGFYQPTETDNVPFD